MKPFRNLIISSDLLKDIAGIDEFKGRWDAIGNLAPERLSALKKIATIESVGSSTRIEGVKLTDDQIEKLLSGVDITSFQSRDEQEVAGYAELMELIYESYHDILLDENHIRQLHLVLLKYSAKDERHRGYYKSLPNNVEAFDDNGHSIGVIFKTASPFDTPRLMANLVSWAHAAIKTREHHPIMVIGTFIVRFLTIHPFQDGNGRLSRALTALLLLQSGYQYVPYSSLERMVEENKDEYYKALHRAQATIDADESGLNVWLSFFVHCMVNQKNILMSKIDQERLMVPLAPLSEKIMTIVREHGRVTVREAVALTKSNRNTVKDHIKKLTQNGHLKRCGRGKGTWYKKLK